MDKCTLLVKYSGWNLSETGIGWDRLSHSTLTQQALRYHPFDQRTTQAILFGETLPDKGHPYNSMNHYQTPDGRGNAIRSIVESFNKANLLGLGEAIHYTQDICNPYHTTIGKLMEHAAYERYSGLVKIAFVPDKEFSVFRKDLVSSLRSLVVWSNSKLSTLDQAMLINNEPVKQSLTEMCKGVAAEATYELVSIWRECTDVEE